MIWSELSACVSVHVVMHRPVSNNHTALSGTALREGRREGRRGGETRFSSWERLF